MPFSYYNNKKMKKRIKNTSLKKDFQFYKFCHFFEDQKGQFVILSNSEEIPDYNNAIMNPWGSENVVYKFYKEYSKIQNSILRQELEKWQLIIFSESKNYYLKDLCYFSDNNEIKDYAQITDADITRLTKQELEELIRCTLTVNHERLRFNMSGYDGSDGVGSCTVKNIDIVNLFAQFGIYDYTRLLFLDFYKGSGTIYLQYWNAYYDDIIMVDVCGYGTREIIYKIFELTVLSGIKKRER
jgi:hypothetical protein